MRRVALVLFAAAAIVHCGDDDSTSKTTTLDAGTPPPPPVPAPPPPPPVQPPPPDDSGADATTVTSQGPASAIEVLSYDFSSPAPQSGWSMFASFTHPADAGYTLTTTTAGACKIHAYSAPAAPGIDDSAGDIAFTQGAITLATATTAGAGYVVDGGSSASNLLPGTYHVAATGGVVPAFATDVDAATKISISTPDLPDSGPLVVDRTKDLTLIWPAPLSGSLVFIFFGSDGLHDVRCEFPGASGSGTVPKAALATLPVGSGGATAFSRSGLTLDAGGRPVDVSMTFVATNARDGRKYQAILVDYR
jgi:hypothetical protein